MLSVGSKLKAAAAHSGDSGARLWNTWTGTWDTPQTQSIQPKGCCLPEPEQKLIHECKDQVHIVSSKVFLLPKYLQSKLLFHKVYFRKDTNTLQKVFKFHWWNQSSKSQNTQTQKSYENMHWPRRNCHLPVTIYTLGSISVNLRCFAHKTDWNQTVNICSSFRALTHWLHDFMCL